MLRARPTIVQGPASRSRVSRYTISRMPNQTVRYVLLCRHGPHRNHKLISRGDPPQLPTESVAARLREQLQHPSVFGDHPISLRRIVHGTEMETAHTAYVLRGGVASAAGEAPAGSSSGHADGTPAAEAIAGVITMDRNEQLDPAKFPQGTDSGFFCQMIEGHDLPDGYAVMVVGHQPHLSWLSHELLKKGRPPGLSYAVPIAAAELICIAVRFRHRPDRSGQVTDKRGRARLLWAIAPDDKDAAAEIREKIKSEMDTAKVLATVITFGLGALLGVLLDPNKCQLPTCRVPAQLSAGLLFASLVLYLASMYAYDRLMMPDRFWADRRPHGTVRIEPRPTKQPRWAILKTQLSRGSHRVRSWRLSWTVRRPPSSTARVLYLNMMRVWRGMFMPATASVVFALLALAFAALQPLTWHTWGWVVTGLLAALTLATIFWFRPVLGTED